MSLQVMTLGAGPQLVLLHGWGLNSQVWLETAELLAKNFQVVVPDLPGHGGSPMPAGAYTVENILADLEELITPGVFVVGWSLGGLFALRFALSQPQNIPRLILVGANAQFVKTDQWPYAMPASVLQGFAQGLEKDYKATLQRFLALQSRGGDGSRETIRLLRQRVEQNGLPRLQALRGGLRILEQQSCVELLPNLLCPSLIMHGRLDTLVPVQAAEAMVKRIPGAKLSIFERSAHAPFLTHREEFVQQVESFLLGDGL